MRAVIIGGAPINEYSECKKYFGPDDFYIFCDSGLYHKEKLGIKPNLIIGDFDSHAKPDADCQIITLPREKDDTDTVYAVKEAISRGFNNFLLIGVVGARLDHTLGNVSILLYLDSLGKKGCIIDDYSEMEIVSDKPVSICNQYAFFSLLNITGCAEGITITGAKYPLDGAELSCEYQYGVSNEVLPGKTATVSVAIGKLLLIKLLK